MGERIKDNGGMKEILYSEKDLMSDEEIKAWEMRSVMAELFGGDDPLELLGRNRGKKREAETVKGGGPDDGDALG